MRYAILSDIHANLDALESVLESIAGLGVDRYLCLGDLVGYGACPQECLDRVEELAERTVAGNHDFAALGKLEIDGFNAYAREATLWTREQLGRNNIAYLESLPLVEHFDGFSIVHGTLYSPELFDYIQTSYDAYLSLSQLRGDICFLGHSHIPVTFVLRRCIAYSFDTEITIEPGSKYLINVGSVGQPRDNDPRAAYAIYDTEKRKVWIKRAAYDIEAAAGRIRAAGLPDVLGERLKVGR